MKNIGSYLWNLIERVLKLFVYRVFRLSLSEKGWDSLLQFFKFAVVGLSNTIIGYLLYAVSLKLLRVFHIFPAADIYIAQLIMFLLSVLWSFYWNNKAVFKAEEGEHRNIGKALLRTYASYAFTGLFLSELLLLLWVRVLGVSEYVAPIINLLVTVPLNFIIQKFWAFRKK